MEKLVLRDVLKFHNELEQEIQKFGVELNKLPIKDPRFFTWTIGFCVKDLVKFASQCGIFVNQSYMNFIGHLYQFSHD